MLYIKSKIKKTKKKYFENCKLKNKKKKVEKKKKIL